METVRYFVDLGSIIVIITDITVYKINISSAASMNMSIPFFF